MLKWSFLGIGAAWGAAMLYEWLWSAMQSPKLLFLAAAGVFLGGVLFVQLRRRRSLRVQPMVWFILAAITAALFHSALERTVEEGLTHVPLLPMYPILFLDFFASGCYTWWRKRKGQGR